MRRRVYYIMCVQRDVLREIYVSDVILADQELEMLEK